MKRNWGRLRPKLRIFLLKFRPLLTSRRSLNKLMVSFIRSTMIKFICITRRSRPTRLWNPRIKESKKKVVEKSHKKHKENEEDILKEKVEWMKEREKLEALATPNSEACKKLRADLSLK